MGRMTLRSIRKGLGVTVASAVAAVSVLLPASSAWADGPSSGTGKGIAGGALLGAELVVSVEALAGVQNPWAYAAGVVVGAGGGGVGGYFIEQSADTRVPLYRLAGGMALAIPATIVALNATSYHPPADYQEDKGAQGAEPAADAPGTVAPPPAPAGPTSSLPKTFQLRSSAYYAPAPKVHVTHATVPTSMVQVTSETVRLGVPAVEVRPVFSAVEMRQFGVSQKEEIRVPLFRAVF